MDKQFSLYSHVHKTHSRIDSFVIDKTLLPLVTTSEYQARIISNHTPLTLELQFVSDESFITRINQTIDNYVETNQTNNTSPILLWETLKAVLRGEIISCTAYLKKTY